MLAIKVNNQYLDLSESTKINMYIRNPLTTKQGAFSYNFNFPNTLRNQSIFGYPHDVNIISIKSLTFKCTLSFGVELLHGYLFITNTNNDYITARFTQGNSTFYNITYNLKLTDLNQSEPTYAEDNEDDTVKNPDNYNFVFAPVIMNEWDDPDFDEEIGTYENWKTVNLWNPQTLKFYKPTGFGDSYNDVYQFIGYYKLYYVVKKVFELYGYSLINNIFEIDPELKTLVIFNVHPVSNRTMSFKNDLPDMLIRDFLSSLENKFCFNFVVNDQFKNVEIVFNSPIISSNKVENITSKCGKQIELDHTVSEGVALKTVWDSQDKYAGRKLDVDNPKKTITVDLKINLPNAEYYATRAKFDIVYYVREDGNYYTAVYDDYLNAYVWKITCDYYNNYLVGNSENVFQTNISTCLMQEYNDPDNDLLNRPFDRRFLPRCDIPRSRNTKNSDKMQLLFYRGNFPYYKTKVLGGAPSYWEDGRQIYITSEKKMYTKVNGEWTNPVDCEPNACQTNFYPMLSSDIYWHGKQSVDHDGVFVIEGAKYRLSYHGTYGLYENFWKEFLYWQQNYRIPVQKMIYWQSNDIAKLDLTKKFRIDSQNFIISEIPLKLYLNKMEVGETKLERVY